MSKKKDGKSAGAGQTMRLDRFLSEETELTRSEIKKKIKAGGVRVNGTGNVRPETKVDPAVDKILLDGKDVEATGMVYVMMNKPQGVLSATEDRRAKTVVDLIFQPGADSAMPESDRAVFPSSVLKAARAGKLFPVGRLDKDTEGLLLLTNDGMLAHNMLSPAKHVYKVYFVVADGNVTREDEDRFLRGMDIGEEKDTLPAVMRRLTVDGDFLSGMAGGQDPAREGCRADASSVAGAAIGADAASGAGAAIGEDPAAGLDEMADLSARVKEFCARSLTLADLGRCSEHQSICAVALREGKFHQVKRMFEKIGKPVVFLKRISMGPLVLDKTLIPGQYRKLTDAEMDALSSYL